MQRIDTLLHKVSELAARGDKNTVIDIDLMLDYVKVVYADLLEWRGRVVFTGSLEPHQKPAEEPAQPPAKVETKTDAAADVVEISASAAPEPVPQQTVSGAESKNLEDVAEIAIQQAEAEAPAPVSPYNFPIRKDIRRLIGINDKYLFISELFGNDRDTYEKTLDEINNKDSYNEALSWLNENVLFVNKTGDEGTETAQMFYDTLSSFFSDK